MPRNLTRSSAIVAVASLSAAPAFAHVGVHDASTLTAGLLHPLMGLDHLLAMALVGVWATQLGGRALWLLPLTFVCALLAGCAVAMGHLPLGFVETGIAASVVALGAVVASQTVLPTSLAVGAVVVFGLFHGYAHGSELPPGGDVIGFVAGFVSGTALLHTLGVAFGVAVSRSAVIRLSGGAAMVAGLSLLYSV